jgi:2-(1,2-epoxy-1,2-dihydrophenyl)acetyl-CoA isomerase
MTANEMQRESEVLFEVVDSVGVITLNRPTAYNAINIALGDSLRDAVIRCDEDPAIRAVLITGKGPAFCSGGDVRQMREAVAADGHAGKFLKTLTVSLHAIIGTIIHMPKPVITAVNGAAAGAGLSLALVGDLILAAEEARFTVAYTAIGLAPDGGSTFLLPRLIGPKRAYELMVTNEALSAEEAKALGIVNRVHPRLSLSQQSLEFATKLAKGPKKAFGHAKRLVTLSAQSSFESQMEHERRPIAACGHTADFIEGADAFFGKRTPNFQNL